MSCTAHHVLVYIKLGQQSQSVVARCTDSRSSSVYHSIPVVRYCDLDQHKHWWLGDKLPEIVLYGIVRPLPRHTDTGDLA